MNTVPDTEGTRRAFRTSESLVRQLMRSQTGSLRKAVMELVCNAVDAGARTIDVSLGQQHIEIRDDGRGFGTLEEIEHHFEEFGFDHDTEQEQGRGRLIGRFGLGRGQIMSHGITRWETGRYEMTVDVRHEGIPSYVLKRRNAEPMQGCRVTVDLFEAMSRTEQAQCAEDIGQHLEWAPGTIRIDGTTINKDPASRRWTAQSERLWFEEKPNRTQGVAIYSQGVYVQTLWHGQVGASGVLVSKVGHPFDLNMGRNEIRESCPLWKEGLDLIRAAKGKRRAHGKLNDADREALWADLRIGATHMNEAEGSPIFRTINGRNITWKTLRSRWGARITVAPTRASQAAEMAHRNRDACVLDKIMLEWTGTHDAVSLATHINAIADRDQPNPNPWTHHAIKALDFAEVCAPYESDIHIVEPSRWRSEEIDAMSGLKILGKGVARALASTERTLVLAEAQGRLAWTDGRTWVAFERTFLVRNARRAAEGWNCLLHTMVHEYLHANHDEDTHAHPPEFYERFHNTVTSERWPGMQMVLNAMSAQAKTSTARGKRARRATLVAIDALERTPPSGNHRP